VELRYARRRHIFACCGDCLGSVYTRTKLEQCGDGHHNVISLWLGRWVAGSLGVWSSRNSERGLTREEAAPHRNHAGA
jgi:hypothetical protein